jgi:hypothetical protein
VKATSHFLLNGNLQTSHFLLSSSFQTLSFRDDDYDIPPAPRDKPEHYAFKYRRRKENTD